MRIIFKDGTSVEHVAATSAQEDGNILYLKDGQGDIVAEINLNDVESYETIV
jgi:hypothetical protein